MTAFEGLSSQTPVLDWFFLHKTKLKRDKHLQREEIITSELFFKSLSNWRKCCYNVISTLIIIFANADFSYDP